jgi:hypothetical protein
VRSFVPSTSNQSFYISRRPIRSLFNIINIGISITQLVSGHSFQYQRFNHPALLGYSLPNFDISINQLA